jgi:glycosyl hydrolase family 65/MarR family protein
VVGGFCQFVAVPARVAVAPVEDESIVNLPNWLPVTFRFEDHRWFDVSNVELLEYRQELDLRWAVLIRELRFRDPEGLETAMIERRLVSMANPHLAALQTTLLPVNWSGLITVLSARDGRVVNGGVERYRGSGQPPPGIGRRARGGCRCGHARGRDQPLAHPDRGVRGVCRIARRRLALAFQFVPDLIDNLRKQIQERLDQLLAEAEKLRRALAALDPRRGSSRTGPTESPRPRPASTPQRRTQARRTTGRTAPGATKARVLGALTDGNAMTAGEVATATGLPTATVSTTLSRLAKSGEVVKAERGYRLPS